MAGIISVDERVSVAYGSFDQVLVTADYNLLQQMLEHKSYAPGIGLVKETTVDSQEIVQLVSIRHDSKERADSGCGG